MKRVFAFAQRQPPVLPANEHSLKRCNLSKKSKRILYGCVLFFTLVDIFCKVLAINNALPKINISIVKLEYFANPGIAFSIPLPQAVILSSTGIIIALFIGLYISTTNQKIKIALYTTILGAGSNFIDRLITGHVTDYLMFFNTSAINIADILICIGIGSCAWYYQKADKET